MDSNSKLGPQIIQNDPHEQTANGRILAGIVERHGLIVANGLKQKCSGLITRRRVTKDNIEESVIDHVILSEDLQDDLDNLNIDEEKKHVLNKIIKTKKGVAKTESDHNALISKFNISWDTRYKTDRIELFNLKNRESQTKFKEMSSGNNNLSSIFDSKDDLNICTKRFLKKLDEYLFKCFKKVRICERPNKDIENLFEKRKILRA